MALVLRTCEALHVNSNMQSGCRTSVPVKWLGLCHSSENMQPAFLKIGINCVIVKREVTLSTLLGVKNNLSFPFLWWREVSQKTKAYEITAPKITYKNGWGRIPLPAQSSSLVSFYEYIYLFSQMWCCLNFHINSSYSLWVFDKPKENLLVYLRKYCTF